MTKIEEPVSRCAWKLRAPFRSAFCARLCARLCAVLAAASCACVANVATAAQTQDLDPSRFQLGQQGKIFLLRFAPESQTVTVEFTGRKAVQFDPERVEVLGRVLSESGDAKSLHLKPTHNQYHIEDPLDGSTQLEFTVKDRQKKRQETFRFRTGPR